VGYAPRHYRIWIIEQYSASLTHPTKAAYNRVSETPASAIRRMAGQLTDLGMGGSVWGDGGVGKS